MGAVAPREKIYIYDVGNYVKGNVFPVHGMRTYRGSGSIAALMLNLGTRWSG